jgi:hypothetical protein
VRLDLKNESEVGLAYREILKSIRLRQPEARIVGLIVEEMAPPGKEIILGMNRDIQFGPILMFGLGGIYVEALEDVTFRLAPIREYSAMMMIRKTKAHKILDGFRGGPVFDIEASSLSTLKTSKSWISTRFSSMKKDRVAGSSTPGSSSTAVPAEPGAPNRGLCYNKQLSCRYFKKKENAGPAPSDWTEFPTPFSLSSRSDASCHRWPPFSRPVICT